MVRTIQGHLPCSSSTSPARSSLTFFSVGVRLRPINDDDVSLATTQSRTRFGRPPKYPHERGWKCSSNTLEQTGVRRTPDKTVFSFDHMFDEDSSTQSVYDEMVRPIVWGVSNGIHGTVFCYGQTGSGKTFTMQGNDLAVRQVDGLLQLAAKDIFKWIDEFKRDSSVRISYFEIYNEQVGDLLSGVVEEDWSYTAGLDTFEGQPVMVRDDPKEGVQVNCRQVEVKNVDVLLDMLQFGNRSRQVAATSMNHRSSRSHAIFRVMVETRATDGTSRLSTLNLVDLAGSENSRTSETTHLRKREGGTINKSLLSLSKVIYSLSLPPASRPKFISYRDSKLTFILQPHLSGNALMAVICNVNPSHVFIEETRSTLRFASRAKLIETKAHVNEVATDNSLLVEKLSLELEATQQALVAMRERSVELETASLEATSELKKVKQLIFGDEEFRLDSVASRSTQRRKPPRAERSIPTIDETRVSMETTENHWSEQNTTQFSAMSIPRITRRRDPANVSKTPPSEVLILTNEPREHGETAQLYAADMEQKANFLEHRLEFAEDMIESLKNDLRSARNALHQLVHKNVQLASKVERYRETLETRDDGENAKLRSQYILLKWSMYLSLLFYVLRLQDLFIVVVMFVWLSLETYTT